MGDAARPASGEARSDAAAEMRSGLAMLAQAAMAAIQLEVDAVERQVQALLDEAATNADAIRARGDREAREILERAERQADEARRRGSAEAEAVEFAAKERARELRAQLDVRLRAKLEWLCGGRQNSAPDSLGWMAPPAAPRRVRPWHLPPAPIDKPHTTLSD